MRLLDLATVCLVASTVAFATYGIDKAAAVRGCRRIPESFLHLLGVAGGWPGALAGRHVFRHKTRKVSFRIVTWLGAALNISLVLWLAE
jgi:uncharacterized membrane protein YsdA (DUF1294 family)